MNRIIIIVTILLFFPFHLRAQQSIDSLFLKNGSVVYGKIIEVENNQYKIKTADGFLFSFSSLDVERFVLGKPAHIRSQSEPGEISIAPKTGYGFGLESGFLIGSGEESFFLLYTFNPMFTYTFDTRNTLALVSGIEIFDNFYVPFYIEYKFNILKKNVSPFFYARGGGLMSIGEEESGEEYKGGWSFGTGTGIRWPIADFESYIKFGFRYCYTVRTVNHSYSSSFPTEYRYEYYFYRIEIKWGFKF